MKKALLALLLALLTMVPAGAGIPDRTTPPRPGLPPALKMPPVVKRQLPNGIPVWFVQRNKVPLVSVNLLFRAGAMQDPVGQAGLASFTTACLDEGAGARDSLEFADAVDMLGADLSANCSFDGTVVGLEVPTARLEPALDLMADMVLRPRFAQADIDRLRARFLTSFLQMRMDPSSLANAAFLRAVYGEHHRYGTSSSGTAAQFAGLTRQDLLDFHRQLCHPALASFVVTGDVEPDQVMKLLGSRFGSWKASGPALSDVPTRAVPARGRGIFLVDRPDSPQSVLRVGMVGVERATPDFFPLQILNTVLGGSFTSRLNQNLRERNGFTYGASSSFAMRRAPGPFLVSTSVQADKTGAALGEILSELEAIRQPIPEPELLKARSYAAYSFPGEFETCTDLAAQVLEMQLYGLPDSYFSEYVARLLEVDAASTARAATRTLVPEDMALVVVGDARVVTPQLESLGLGQVRILEVDEFLGPAIQIPPARP